MDPNLKISTLQEVWQQSSEQHWLPVCGVSMLPLLHEGDSILISHDLSKVQRGDILVFQSADGLVAHRVGPIIKQNDYTQTHLTKGDNSHRFDPPIFEKEALGKVIAIRKNGREYSLTTTGQRIWNRFLGTCHLLLGTLFQAAHNLMQSIHK